ncbi:hypothetical protein OIU77_007297 [Salix suchowensis]|uniref:Uncharacterized protein n=1 Tax=Salix suchowensis TaxID=1278906 RepID=A0ABQ9AGT6_9ROSI|nr:hypothetical protein OIU77_007297 [Salix suchowensis]
MYVQPGVTIVIGNRSPESQGTVYISTKNVVWLSDVDRTKGYSVDFLSLSLHAVSREPEAYSSPCICTQIEAGDEYLCECAELNPEPIKDNEKNTIGSLVPTNWGKILNGISLENPSSSNGRSNGDHDLARTVLEVGW